MGGVGPEGAVIMAHDADDGDLVGFQGGFEGVQRITTGADGSVRADDLLCARGKDMGDIRGLLRCCGTVDGGRAEGCGTGGDDKR